MKKTAIIMAAAWLLGASASSSAAIINFEDIAVAPGVNDIGGDRISGGFSFDSSTNHLHVTNDTFDGNSGSTFLVTDDFNGAATTTMSLLGGGLFSISSIQLGEWNSPQLASDITVTGHLSGGGTIQTTFTLDGVVSVGGSNNFETFLFGAGWTDLTSVVFDATAGNPDNYWAMDNIVVDVAQVPEPATLALFGIGLAGLSFSRRKRTAH